MLCVCVCVCVCVLVCVVTLGRALELGHKPTVVSALAAETGQQFTVAGEALKTLDSAQFGKWSAYLALKAAFYESYVSIAPALISSKCEDSL